MRDNFTFKTRIRRFFTSYAQKLCEEVFPARHFCVGWCLEGLYNAT